MKVLALLFAAVAVLTPVTFAEEAAWEDTEMTTNLWRAIASLDNDQLLQLLDADETVAHVRASDGRGPLWWAYEYGNKEAIELLYEYGADDTVKDADGKGPKDVADMSAPIPKSEPPPPPPAAPQQAQPAAAAHASDAGDIDYDDDEDEPEL
jgi:hypothetical protein